MSDSAPRPNADDEWESLLRQWRAQPAAQPRPYFYSRVRARLASAAATARPPVRTWLHWPAYAVLLGALLLLSGDDAGLPPVGGDGQNTTRLPDTSVGGELYRESGR